MKYYDVIDTNVLVSAMLKRDSYPGKILDLVNLDVIVPLMNGEILDEYFDVLSRSKFRFNIEDVITVFKTINEKSMFLDRKPANEDFIDEDDVVFYEVLMDARDSMDAYLVTGNIKHFPSKPYVVTPKQMIEIIDKEIL